MCFYHNVLPHGCQVPRCCFAHVYLDDATCRRLSGPEAPAPASATAAADPSAMGGDEAAMAAVAAVAAVAAASAEEKAEEEAEPEVEVEQQEAGEEEAVPPKPGGWWFGGRGVGLHLCEWMDGWMDGKRRTTLTLTRAVPITFRSARSLPGPQQLHGLARLPRRGTFLCFSAFDVHMYACVRA